VRSRGWGTHGLGASYDCASDDPGAGSNRRV